jgi:hypothetical protein
VDAGSRRAAVRRSGASIRPSAGRHRPQLARAARSIIRRPCYRPSTGGADGIRACSHGAAHGRARCAHIPRLASRRACSWKRMIEPARAFRSHHRGSGGPQRVTASDAAGRQARTGRVRGARTRVRSLRARTEALSSERLSPVLRLASPARVASVSASSARSAVNVDTRPDRACLGSHTRPERWPQAPGVQMTRSDTGIISSGYRVSMPRIGPRPLRPARWFGP